MLFGGCCHYQAAYGTCELGQPMESSLAQGRVLQDAWNLFAFSVVAIGTAVRLNWKMNVGDTGSMSARSALLTSGSSRSCCSLVSFRLGREYSALSSACRA
jgi:hypothetical protein